MEKQTYITKNAMVQVNNLIASNWKTAFQVIVDTVAEIKGTREYDVCFEMAYDIGMEQGTAAYDECISIILKELEIEESVILERLRLEGINI